MPLAEVSRRPRVSMLQFIYYSSSTLDRFLCLKFSWVDYLMNFVESNNLNCLKVVHNQNIILHYFSLIIFLLLYQLNVLIMNEL